MHDECPDEVRWMAFVEAAIDGARDARLDEHLATCPACAQKVTAVWTSLLAVKNLSPGGRRLCPPVDALSGELTPELRHHLACCVHCREELADLEALQAEPAWEIAVRLVGRALDVVSQTFAPDGPELVPVPVSRGPEATAPVRFTRPCGTGRLSLVVSPAGPDGVSVSVTMEPAPAPGARVDLERDGTLIESRRIDPVGTVAFVGLARDRFRLIVRAPGLEAVPVDLAVVA